MTNKPDPQILLKIYTGVLEMEKKELEGKWTASTPVKLNKLPKGAWFKRKPNSKKQYIKEHYNRRNAFEAASYTCTDIDDIGRCIFLKPTTTVFVEG